MGEDRFELGGISHVKVRLITLQKIQVLPNDSKIGPETLGGGITGHTELNSYQSYRNI